MSELEDLYQEMILDHYKKPRNLGTLPDPTHAAHGDNPLCGDKLALQVRMKGDLVEEIRFKGAGCAISVASASMMTDAIKGRSRADVQSIFDRFHRMVTGETVADMGKLDVFAGVSEFPVRVKCATLAWHTLLAAIEGKADPVTTE